MLARFVAAQLRRPSGRAGLLFGRLLNRVNRNMNRRAVAHLILRVLKPGGRLVLGCATKAQLERSSATQHGFSHYGSNEVSTMLREAGFSGIEEATPSGEPFFFAVAHRPEPIA